MSDRRCPRSRVEQQDCPMLHGLSSESDSTPQLVGSIPPNVAWMGQMEEGVGPSLGIPASWPRGRPPKQCPSRNGAGNSSPSSPKRDGVDSNGYSTVSETLRSHHHNRRRCSEKQLTPTHLDMLIFKLTYLNVDITYTLWRFDVQEWLDQYQEESMMPHIYNSLRGYPGRWVHFLNGDNNMTVTELLEQMDCMFGDVQEYDTMIRSMYEIRQKEGESVEDSNELGSTSTVEHEIWITDSEPFKERFRQIPPLLLEEVCVLLCRGHLPQPIPMVQCSGTGEEEGWYAALLHGFPQASRFWVTIKHDHVMVQSQLEGVIIGATEWGEAEANESLLCEHVHLVDEVRVQAMKPEPMHVVDWQEAQEGDMALAACNKWLKAQKDTPSEQLDALLKKYLDSHADTEEEHALFSVYNSLTMSKGLLYLSTMPKGELEGVLAFLVPSS